MITSNSDLESMTEDNSSRETTPPAAEVPAVPPDGAFEAPEVVQVETQADTETAQIPVNEPFDSAHDRPLSPAPAQKTVPAPSSAPVINVARDLWAKALVAIRGRRQEKLNKIMAELNKKGKNGSTSSPQVTNDEVEKLLHVSDATAARYLSALVKEGKLKQVGKTGTGVVYTKV